MAFRSSSTSQGNSDIASTAVPAGVAIDDIVLLVVTIDQGTADWTGKQPSPFIELDETGHASGVPDGDRNGLFWKRLTAVDSGSYTFATIGAAGPWVCQAYAFSGRHLTDAPVSSGTLNTTANPSAVAITAPSVVAVEGDDMVMFSIPDVTDTDVANGHTTPANYTVRHDAEFTWSNLAGFTRNNVTVGATGTVTSNLTLTGFAAGWLAWHVRIPTVTVIPPDTIYTAIVPTQRMI